MRRRFFLRGAALVLACALAARAGPAADAARDVHLRDGRVLRALAVREDGDRLVLVLASGTVTVPRSRVLRVVRHAEGRGPAINVAGVSDPQPAPPEVPPSAAAAGTVVEEALRAALIADGRSPVTLVALGELLVGQSRHRDALEPLTEAGRGLPEPLQRRRDLALAEALSHLDRTEDALAVLAQTPEDGQGSVAGARARVQGDQDVRAERAAFGSTHFVLQAPEGTAARDVRALLQALEGVHERLSLELGAGPRERVIVLLHPGTEFWERTGQSEAVLGLYDGKVRVPSGRLNPPSPALTDVLRHEVTHAFVHALSAGRAGRLWHEGLAEHFEDAEPPASAKALARFAEASGAWPPPESHAVARARAELFIERHGMATVRDLLAALAAGASEDEALRRLIGTDAAGFDEQWRRQVIEEAAR